MSAAGVPPAAAVFAFRRFPPTFAAAVFAFRRFPPTLRRLGQVDLVADAVETEGDRLVGVLAVEVIDQNYIYPLRH